MSNKILIRTLNAYTRSIFGLYVKPNRYEQIFKEIEQSKPKVIVEVGTWNGARAKQMIETAAKNVPLTMIHYIGFDIFEKITKELYNEEVSKMPPTQHEVASFLGTTGVKITLLAGLTQDTMRQVGALPKADFVFIDGGHAAETVRNDWEGIKKIMHKNTVVIFDDYWQNRSDGPRVVIDNIDRQTYNVEILPETDVFFNPDFGRLVISLVKVTLK
jgi:predicted O-methyltransferase YrrM